VGLLRLIRALGMQSSFESLVIAHVVVATPYVVTLVAASLEQSDRRQEEAARNLGANAFQTFWYVTLPAIRPGLVAAGIFAFIVSFEEVTVTAFLIGGRLMTLPVRIYSESQFALEPTISAISTLLVALSVVVLLLLSRFVRLDKFWVR
jgi:ABC-type spermidine/putrescine transport system permease subunit II